MLASIPQSTTPNNSIVKNENCLVLTIANTLKKLTAIVNQSLFGSHYLRISSVVSPIIYN
jgi:hypothetical protein